MSKTLVYGGRIKARLLLWVAIHPTYAQRQAEAQSRRPWAGCSGRL